MFTGIIIDVGIVDEIKTAAYGTRLSIRSERLKDVATAESVAVNGVCLTVADTANSLLHFDCVQETLNRSSLGSLKRGSRVNLELPVGAGEPMGGHFVQGHVDCKGLITEITADESNRSVRIECPPHIMQLIVEKGSVAVDGISFTVASCNETSFTVAIIPFTWEETNLRDRVVGQDVNIETDILAKYIAKFLPPSMVPEILRAEATGAAEA
ncbi:MAG: riboflavin synthase [Armatimonadota bacterium]